MRFDGTLKTWNDERGVGFIAPSQGGDDIFVHIQAFAPRSGRPQIPDRQAGPGAGVRPKPVHAPNP